MAVGFFKKNRIMANKKTLKIKFLLSPTGLFNLGYNEGDVASLSESITTELVENKYAEYVK